MENGGPQPLCLSLFLWWPLKQWGAWAYELSWSHRTKARCPKHFSWSGRRPMLPIDQVKLPVTEQMFNSLTPINLRSILFVCISRQRLILFSTHAFSLLYAFEVCWSRAGLENTQKLYTRSQRKTRHIRVLFFRRLRSSAVTSLIPSIVDH